MALLIEQHQETTSESDHVKDSDIKFLPFYLDVKIGELNQEN